MQNSTISLLIQGNRDSAAGFGPLINVGVFPSEERDRMDEGAHIQEDLNYKIRHTDNYIFYTIKSSNVKSYGVQRKGRLVICVAIPRDKQLTEGNSPFTLLKAIYHTFLSENMTPIENGNFMYKPNEYQSESFKGILDTYSLESRQGPYHPMLAAREKGIVCVSDENALAQLFLDSQYPEFRKFSEIEIGTACSDIANLHIDIPRKRTYSVFLNGKDTGKQLLNDEDSYESYLVDTEYHTCKNVLFSLGELLSSTDGLFNGSVRIDKVNERIDCCVMEEDKEFVYTTEIRESNETKLNKQEKEKIVDWFKEKRIKIKYSNEENDFNDVFLNKEKLTILGKNDLKEITLSTKNVENYYFKIVKQRTERKIILFVEKKIPEYHPLAGLNDYPPSWQQQNNNPKKDKRETCFCLTLTLLEQKQYDVEVFQNKLGDRRRVKLFNVDITPIDENYSNEKKLYTTSLCLDKSWSNKTIYIQITNRTDNTQAVLEDYFVNKDDEIKIPAYQFEKMKSSSSRSSRKVVTALLVVCLAFGGAGIRFFIGQEKRGDEPIHVKNDEEKSQTGSYGPIEENEDLDEEGNLAGDGVTGGTVQTTPTLTKSKNQVREKLREEILAKVNASDFNKIQHHAGWKNEYLSFEERTAIEALFYGIKIGNKIVIYSEYHAARQKKDKLLEEKGNFSSIEEIVDFKNVIVKVLN